MKYTIKRTIKAKAQKIVNRIKTKQVKIEIYYIYECRCIYKNM